MRPMFSNFFLCKWGLTLFPLTYWVSLIAVFEMPDVFNYTLTKVGMLRERLCFVISKLTVFFLLCVFIVYPCEVDTPIWYKHVKPLAIAESKLNVEM